MPESAELKECIHSEINERWKYTEHNRIEKKKKREKALN
jgi:hypothetical protein